MNEHFYYLIIDLASLSFPLLFSFHPSIKFYKEWKPLFLSIVITAFFFIIWDEWFTRINVWSFNHHYVTGIYLGHLPLEELMFFILIPYCLMFMYHCSARYFVEPKKESKNLKRISLIIALVILGIGIVNKLKWYTSFTFTITGTVLLVLPYTDFGRRVNWKRFAIVYLLGLLPFFIVNGLLTSIPIVLYNNQENLSLRISTIPVEDLVYNLLLFTGNVTLYEYFRKTKIT